MKITIAQLDPIVGDVDGNLHKAVDVLSRCRNVAGDVPDLVVFPELYLSGYPPKDLLERPWFVEQVQRGVEELRRISAGFPEIGVLIGAPWPTLKRDGKGLYNAALLLQRGQIVAKVHKCLLPTYDVFDEGRYFDPACDVQPVAFKGERLGIHICEDAWTDPEFWAGRQPYAVDPIATLAAQGATLLINISASPFSAGKEQTRYRLIRQHARRYGLPFLYVNQVGGNDELIFDGRSICVDGAGEVMAVLPSFQEHVATIDTRWPGTPGAYVPQEEIASVHDALVLGLRDYLFKCGFSRAVIGLSGGIDSSLTCCLAVEALGPEHVLGISMPSPYSSTGSVEDSRQLARNLGIAFKVIPIASLFGAYLEALQPHFEGREPDVAEENVQARIRGNLLMAMSNKFGYIVLTTGNKSELAVGYCTLYGDMSGGLAVIADVPKTMVYQLAHYVNRHGEVIPKAVIDKAPSAELRPNQTDQDTLPPYDILDPILHYYVEERWSVEQIVAQGFEERIVRWVARAVDRNEYKRQQAAPALRVTSKAFGFGRRMPIAARFKV